MRANISASRVSRSANGSARSSRNSASTPMTLPAPERKAHERILCGSMPIALLDASRLTITGSGRICACTAGDDEHGVPVACPRAVADPSATTQCSSRERSTPRSNNPHARARAEECSSVRQPHRPGDDLRPVGKQQVHITIASRHGAGKLRNGSLRHQIAAQALQYRPQQRMDKRNPMTLGILPADRTALRP